MSDVSSTQWLVLTYRPSALESIHVRVNGVTWRQGVDYRVDLQRGLVIPLVAAGLTPADKMECHYAHAGVLGQGVPGWAAGPNPGGFSVPIQGCDGALFTGYYWDYCTYVQPDTFTSDGRNPYRGLGTSLAVTNGQMGQIGGSVTVGCFNSCNTTLSVGTVWYDMVTGCLRTGSGAAGGAISAWNASGLSFDSQSPALGTPSEMNWQLVYVVALSSGPSGTIRVIADLGSPL